MLNVAWAELCFSQLIYSKDFLPSNEFSEADLHRLSNLQPFIKSRIIESKLFTSF